MITYNYCSWDGPGPELGPTPWAGAAGAEQQATSRLGLRGTADGGAGGWPGGRRTGSGRMGGRWARSPRKHQRRSAIYLIYNTPISHAAQKLIYTYIYIYLYIYIYIEFIYMHTHIYIDRERDIFSYIECRVLYGTCPPHYSNVHNLVSYKPALEF